MFTNQLKDVIHLIRRIPLKNKNFTIISNNCWGGFIYQGLGLPYLTPTVGLYMHPSCYLRLLHDPKRYFDYENICFTDNSKYEIVNEEIRTGKVKPYPIGVLGGDVEIHFLHYSSIFEAQTKWSRRSKRVNWDNMFIKFCDRDGCTIQHIEEFEKLPFRNKVCFTSKNYPQFNSTIWIKEDNNEPSVRKDLYGIANKYFDVVEWLNTGSGKNIGAVKHLINSIIYR